MKSKTYLFLLLLMSLFITSCEEKKINGNTSLQDEGLKGKVKSIKEIKYSVKEISEDVVKDEICESKLYFYNKEGNLITKNYYEEKDEIKENYVYDKNGNLIERYCVVGAFQYRYSYIYDDLGNMVRINMFSNDGVLLKKIDYAYDDLGNITECKTYNKIDSLIERENYFYKFDEDNNIIEELYFRSDNCDSDYKQKKTYLYDDDRNLIAMTLFDDGVRYNYSERYGYDYKGNLNESTYCIGHDCVEDYHNFEDFYCKDIFIYTYDKNDNWIEKKVYYQYGSREAEIEEIYERIIEYYK